MRAYQPCCFASRKEAAYVCTTAVLTVPAVSALSPSTITAELLATPQACQELRTAPGVAGILLPTGQVGRVLAASIHPAVGVVLSVASATQAQHLLGRPRLHTPVPSSLCQLLRCRVAGAVQAASAGDTGLPALPSGALGQPGQPTMRAAAIALAGATAGYGRALAQRTHNRLHVGNLSI